MAQNPNLNLATVNTFAYAAAEYAGLVASHASSQSTMAMLAPSIPALSPRGQELLQTLLVFMDENIYPNEEGSSEKWPSNPLAGRDSGPSLPF